MDSVFGQQCFRNEITWKRTPTVKGNFGQGSKLWGRNTDSLLFYFKTSEYVFNQPFGSYSQEYIEKSYRYVEPETGRRYRLVSMIGPGGAVKGNPQYEVMGVTRYWRYSKERMEELIDQGLVVQAKPLAVPHRKYYLDEGRGVPIQSLWDDIGNLQASAKERLGYPTQKPQALLERIIRASSNPGDMVLDPFCGCGTAVAVAEKLKRRWIGIDVTHLAVALMKNRIKTAFDLSHGKDYVVVGEPADVGSARALAEQDRYQFQFWAMSLLEALPRESGKKGADRGIDGVVYFIDGPRRSTRKAIVQVKSGKVSSPHIRDLEGTVDREKAAMGLFITLDEPTNAMRTEAVSAGYYRSEVWQRDYPKIQIRTVGELLSDVGFDLPYHPSMYQPAERVQRSVGEQGVLMEAAEAYADKV